MRGFFWTTLAVAALSLRCLIPDWYPEWFVSETGQITVNLGWIGWLIVIGLLIGWHWVRPIALVYYLIGFIAAIPLLNRLFDAQSNYVNEHFFGYALLIGLDILAFCILAFVPSVRERFSRGAE